MKNYKIWLDGGSKGNGSDEAIGYGSYYFHNVDKNESAVRRLKFGKGMTNNEAEWNILISVLEMLLNASDADVKLFMDSKLIINQFNKTWKCKDPRMFTFREKAHELLSELESKNISINLSWLPRENIEIILGH